ncbi:hypothetical protein TUBRATIS_12850 [Tubulinosema ratisbonensis]|uniref:Uncharacterized protein n=1 Tax=Tubulinosema ratisbonensis TaxID=291195 RepID=A0A437AM88_9MICR|nr:hypothetical protein TUBRATIS_12850 [Tubulinosema ratisbonensis]
MTILMILTLKQCSYFLHNYIFNRPYQANLYNTMSPCPITSSYPQYLSPWPTLPIMFFPRQIDTCNPISGLIYNQQRPAYFTQAQNMQSGAIFTPLSINQTTQVTLRRNSGNQSKPIITKFGKKFSLLLCTLIMKKRHNFNIKFSSLTPEEIITAVAPKLDHNVILFGGFIIYFNFFLKGFYNVHKHPPLEARDILSKNHKSHFVSIYELINAAEKWSKLDTMFDTKNEGLKKLIEISSEHNGHGRFDSYDNMKGVLEEDFIRQLNSLFK